MSDIYLWAARWNIPTEAVDDLHRKMTGYTSDATVGATSESGVAQRVRLEAARRGDILWRNNVGAFVDPNTNRQVRYGLANESKRVNQRVKSSDLIGIRRVRITPEMVGTWFGQFMAIETKRPDWTYRGTDHEQAQLRFHEIVIAHGGHARFEK